MDLDPGYLTLRIPGHCLDLQKNRIHRNATTDTRAVGGPEFCSAYRSSHSAAQHAVWIARVVDWIVRRLLFLVVSGTTKHLK